MRHPFKVGRLAEAPKKQKTIQECLFLVFIYHKVSNQIQVAQYSLLYTDELSKMNASQNNTGIMLKEQQIEVTTIWAISFSICISITLCPCCNVFVVVGDWECWGQ